MEREKREFDRGVPLGDRARVLGGGSGVAVSGLSFPNQPASYSARTAGSAPPPGEQHLEGEPQRTTATANNNPQQGKITPHGGGRASNPYDGNTVEGGGGGPSGPGPGPGPGPGGEFG